MIPQILQTNYHNIQVSNERFYYQKHITLTLKQICWQNTCFNIIEYADNEG